MVAAKPVCEIRKAASLIILTKINNASLTHRNFNYNVLLFERPKNMTFMPNYHVFPGGVQEITDISPHWFEYFKEFELKNSLKFSNFYRIESAGKREISSRLTAIRETFEETGLLLCRKNEKIDPNNFYGQYINELADSEGWQKAVHNDPNQFFNICNQYQIIPDIWSLYEWSFWITPHTFKKRYKTLFYLTALENQPNLNIEDTEGMNHQWRTPEEFLKNFRDNQLLLSVPQFYELSRLATQRRIDDLVAYARERQSAGTTAFLPVQYKCIDGIVGVLPGDDQYPNNPSDIVGFVQTNRTVNEFRAQHGKVHRILWVDESRSTIEVNINPLDKHLIPINSKVKNYL